jgi:hypothetical protein
LDSDKKELKLILTFKKTEKYIFDEVQKHSGKGNWIKDILADYIKSNEKTPSDDRA